MVVHDYPVKRQSIEDLERRASDIRMRCGISAGKHVNVLKLLFDEMPEYLKKMGLSLVSRTAAHMGEREAYAAPKARRIFYRPSLLARLKFGDPAAALIFLHELSHVILHRDNGGAEKAWLKEGNEKVFFASEEESAEWQATTLALCLMAPAGASTDVKSAEDLAAKFGLDIKHATQRFEALKTRRPRKIPEIYKTVRAGLANTLDNTGKHAEFQEPTEVPGCVPIVVSGNL